MIMNRLFRQQLKTWGSFLPARNNFSTKQADYYNVLGVDRLASAEQIKDAYRKLALKYHPDVSASVQDVHEPSARKFQEITEAYSVLSVEEQRRSYDFLNQSASERLYTSTQALEDELLRRRSKDGQTIREPYKVGTFAAEKQKLLAEERAKFNVDNLGRYKGGLPIKGKGVLRQGKDGSALGAPGVAHDAMIHQMKSDNDVMDYQNITPEVAQNFANHQNMDRWVHERRKSAFLAKVDYEYFQFNHWRTAFRFFRNLFLATLGVSFLYQELAKNGNNALALKYREHAQTNPGQDLIIGGIKLVQRANGLLVTEHVHASKHAAHH